MSNNQGSLEIISGSMFSGKSEELIRRLRRAELANRKVVSFKPVLDNRSSLEHVVSHNGSRFNAVAIDDPAQMLAAINPSIEVVGIDEIQFFPMSVVGIVLQLVRSGKRVLAAGLDLDFRGLPFGCMPELMALADSTTKLKAICMSCGKDAHHTQRMVNNIPAKFDDPLILVGAQQCYEARCRDCFVIDKPPYTQQQSPL